MTRRMILILTLLVSVVGVVLASASPASAQFGGFDFRTLFTNIFQSLSSAFPFLAGFLSSLFSSLLNAFTGSCAPFCAS